MTPSTLDIFCNVIDNFGDAGVVYRFAYEFKKRVPDSCIRVFIDNLDTLKAIVPEINVSLDYQTQNSITFIHTTYLTIDTVETLGVAQIIVEAFGCTIPDSYLNQALTKSKALFNLEYLSAEQWVEGYHCKESLLASGTLKKYFFMPGFTEKTGGIILNSRIEKIKEGLRKHKLLFLTKVLNSFHIPVYDLNNCLIGSVFTYIRPMDPMLESLIKVDKKIKLLVHGEKSSASFRKSLQNRNVQWNDNFSYCQYENIELFFMPFLKQHIYDALLFCTDFNCVRGEDSLARAVLAGMPFIWNAYLQKDIYQKVKVEALLKTMQPWFDEKKPLFEEYSSLMLEINNISSEEIDAGTKECFDSFFKNLQEICTATMSMSYFIAGKCNLIDNFLNYISDISS